MVWCYIIYSIKAPLSKKPPISEEHFETTKIFKVFKDFKKFRVKPACTLVKYVNYTPDNFVNIDEKINQ